jgi:hypothetical protein
MINVLNILKNDSVLVNYIGSAANIYPVETDYTGECIIYEIVPLSDDKITQKNRLQIHIISKTMAKAIDIEKRVKQLILTLADTPLTTKILKVVMNGGGSLYDGERKKHHRILYFEILSRSE